jgi:hypothetical protein
MPRCARLLSPVFRGTLFNEETIEVPAFMRQTIINTISRLYGFNRV